MEDKQPVYPINLRRLFLVNRKLKVPTDFVQLEVKVDRDTVKLLLSVIENIQQADLMAAIKGIMNLISQYESSIINTLSILKPAIDLCSEYLAHFDLKTIFQAGNFDPALVTKVRTQFEAAKDYDEELLLMEQVSNVIMSAMEFSYPSFIQFLIIIGLVFVLRVYNEDSMTAIAPKGKNSRVELEKEYTNVNEILFNFFIKRSLSYTKDSKHFIELISKHLKLSTATIENYLSGRGEELTEENILYRKKQIISQLMFKQFKKQIEPVFPFPPYRRRQPSTKLNEDQVIRLLSSTVNHQGTTGEFIINVYPQIVKWAGFRDCGDKFNIFATFPYLLCLSTDAQRVFCIDRSFYLKNMSDDRSQGSPTVNKIYKDLSSIIQCLDGDDNFITCIEFKRLLTRDKNSLCQVIAKVLDNVIGSYETHDPASKNDILPDMDKKTGIKLLQMVKNFFTSSLVGNELE